MAAKRLSNVALALGAALFLAEGLAAGILLWLSRRQAHLHEKAAA